MAGAAAATAKAKGGPRPSVEYSITTIPRPKAAPNPRERHVELVERVIATSTATAVSEAVGVQVPTGVAASKLLNTLRQAVQKRIKRDALTLRLRSNIDGRTIALWTEATTRRPTTGGEREAVAATNALEQLKARIVDELRKRPDGLMMSGITRAIYGGDASIVDRTAVQSALASLSRDKRILQDSAMRFTLAG